MICCSDPCIQRCPICIFHLCLYGILLEQFRTWNFKYGQFIDSCLGSNPTPVSQKHVNPVPRVRRDALIDFRKDISR